MSRILVPAILAALAGTACTSQQVYDSTRALRVDQCQQLPVPEQEDCMRQTHETDAEREKRLQGPER